MTGKIAIEYDCSNVKIRRKITSKILSRAARGVFRFKTLQRAIKKCPRLTPIVWNQRRMRRGVGYVHRLGGLDVFTRLCDTRRWRLRR